MQHVIFAAMGEEERDKVPLAPGESIAYFSLP